MNTPFTDFKATEISPEKQQSFFVEPDYTQKLISPKASVIIGERGSGKTTILKHLEKVFNDSPSLDYIGVYYRFETAYMRALHNPELSNEQNVLAFSQSMAVTLAKLLCAVLEKIKEEKGVLYRYEISICEEIASQIGFDIKDSVSTYAELARILERIRKKTMMNLQNGKSVCYIEYTSLMSEFCEMLRKEEVFSKTCFCVLLDEYENLTLSQQRIINSYIKGSSFFLTYKVCMRPDGFLTKETIAEKEQLITGHDYEEFDYVKDIVGPEKSLKQHLRRICANRLEYFYTQQKIAYKQEDLNIDDYFELINEEKELESCYRVAEYTKELKEKLIKRYPKREQIIKEVDKVIDLKLISILFEKKYSEREIFENLIQHSSRYKNWIHNYKQNIIIQITSECEQIRKYFGFDTFVKLSNGNTRRVLEILHYAFGDYDGSGTVYPRISVTNQTKAVSRVSEAAFDQIDYIPVNGYKVKNLANALGNLFAEYAMDNRVKKFETNSFSIVTTAGINDTMQKELKAVLRDAVVWGVLIPAKANKVKNKGDIVFDGKDYTLHPIFAPFFKISYRKRQKCELKDVVVYSMLSTKSRKAMSEISKNIASDEYVQQELELYDGTVQ